MHAAVQDALASDAIKQAWDDQGAKVELESRADFVRFVGQDVERWKRIARAAEIDMD